MLEKVPQSYYKHDWEGGIWALCWTSAPANRKSVLWKNTLTCGWGKKIKWILLETEYFSGLVCGLESKEWRDCSRWDTLGCYLLQFEIHLCSKVTFLILIFGCGFPWRLPGDPIIAFTPSQQLTTQPFCSQPWAAMHTPPLKSLEESQGKVYSEKRKEAGTANEVSAQTPMSDQ